MNFNTNMIKKSSFIKSIKFEGIKTKNLNEWLKRYNKITEANYWIE